MILPAVGFYEKNDTRFPIPHVPWLTLTEAAVRSPGEALEEWEIWRMLAVRLN